MLALLLFLVGDVPFTFETPYTCFPDMETDGDATGKLTSTIVIACRYNAYGVVVNLTL